MEYYQVYFAMDKEGRGNYEMPHTVEITSSDFNEYIYTKNRNIIMYFENLSTLYKKMPDTLTGKILDRKDFVDFMDCSPACPSLVAVVSRKVKNILEYMNVHKSEYILKEIIIDKVESDFFLLFVPLIRDTEFIYPMCRFVNLFDKSDIKLFEKREDYYKAPEEYVVKKITLSNKYENFDLLYPQGICGVFFSERIINAFVEEKISGYDIIRGGIFHNTIDFLG